MSDFVGPKHHSMTYTKQAQIASQNHSPSFHSLIGNQAMQRLLQREGAEQKAVTFLEFQPSVVQAIIRWVGVLRRIM